MSPVSSNLSWETSLEMLSSAPESSHGNIRNADSCLRAVKTEDRDLALPPFASTK